MTTDPGRYGRSLTDREHQVLQLLADGHTQAAIGRRLHMDDRTVRRITAEACVKLRATNATHAISLAYRWGLFDLADALGYDLALVPREDAP